MKKETKLALVAAVLIVAAVALFARYYFTEGTPKYAEPPTKADVDKQISDIQNNPNMPQQAKDIAIGQIKARSQGFGAPTK